MYVYYMMNNKNVRVSESLIPTIKNVRVHPDTKPEPLFRFESNDLLNLNLEHWVRFRFKHCSKCSEPDRGQSILRPFPFGFVNQSK